MNSQIKRPPSVWLTQTLFIIFALLWLGILILNLVPLLGGISEDESILRVAIGFSVILAFVLFLLVAFWGLARRKRFGKWLGLVSLILIWILIVYTQLFPSPGPYQRYEYDNTAQLAGAFVTLSFIHVGFLVLILRLGFSKKVNQFFQKAESNVVA